MQAHFALGAVCALLIAAPGVEAAQGDVYVPAHRTRDGSFVPANVPPSSGGTRFAKSPAHHAAARSTARPFRNAIVAPIFVQAKAVVR